MGKIQGLPGVAAAAIIADEVPGVAVVLHHPFGPRRLVQVVHVLGDDAGQKPSGLQLRQGVVGRIGPGPGDGVVHLLEELPDLGRVAAKGLDMGVFHGVKAVPEAARAPEARDARLNRDAGAG